jgi:hypothetical protein
MCPAIGIGISPFLRYGSGSVPASVLQSWYDSLIVKPSAGLWSDLKIMADGMNTDGDWSEMDLFGSVAGLETDEQRLRPFKTTSGNDCIIEGSPNLSINGIDDPFDTSSAGLDLQWNPYVDGNKFTQNSAYICGFGITKISNISGRTFMGGIEEIIGVVVSKSVISIDSDNTNMIILNGSELNGISNQGASSKALLNSTKTFVIGIKRTDSANIVKYVNDNQFNSSIGSSVLPINGNIGFYGYYYYLDGSPLFTGFIGTQTYGRGYIAGSSLIDHNRVANRLNTFYASRGLSVSNY